MNFELQLEILLAILMPNADKGQEWPNKLHYSVELNDSVICFPVSLPQMDSCLNEQNI